jgi:8-oxo-dGTP pyrophosphatase MutT (NUDIX family)
LPGQQAQLKMAPKGIRNVQVGSGLIPASVLILIYPVNDEPWTVCIKRNEYPGAHSGQISLPGGKKEPGDLNLEHTALRETSEELGIQAESIRILGKLSTLTITFSGFEVHPFVGMIDHKPEWNPDKDEVTYLIETPVKTLSSAKTIKHEMWHLREEMIKVPFFNVKNEKIWGATAMILSEFIEVLRTLRLKTA